MGLGQATLLEEQQMSKLEDDRAKLARVLDCRPSTLDHWFDLLGLLDEAGPLGSQLAAIGAAVEMKRAIVWQVKA